MSEQAPQLQVHPDVDPSAPRHPEQPAFIIPGEVTEGFAVGLEGDHQHGSSKQQEQDRLPVNRDRTIDPPEDESKNPKGTEFSPYEQINGQKKPTNPRQYPIRTNNVQPDLRSPEIRLPNENN